MAISSWPWVLTPLTARVMAAISCLGIGGLVLSIDGRWKAAKTMIEVEALMLVLVLASGIRSRPDLDFSSLLPRALLAGFAATLLASAALHAAMARQESARRAPAPHLH